MPDVMPYALRFYLYLFVAGVLVVVLAVWLGPLGRIVNLLFAIAAGYLTIVIGRLGAWTETALMDTNPVLAVLTDALERCRREDMRIEEVFAALDYLESRAETKWPFDQFRHPLDSDNDEEGRWQTLNASLNGIKLWSKIKTVHTNTRARA